MEGKVRDVRFRCHAFSSDEIRGVIAGAGAGADTITDGEAEYF